MKNEFTLKPCPFCGGEAYIRVVMQTPYITAFHKKSCKIEPNTWLFALDTDIYKQVEIWNKRMESEVTK